MGCADHSFRLQVDPERGASVKGPGARQKQGLGRLLPDAASALRKHNAKMDRDRERRAARGLPPPEPSRQDREIAKARFRMHLGANPLSAKTVAQQHKAARKLAREEEDNPLP